VVALHLCKLQLFDGEQAVNGSGWTWIQEEYPAKGPDGMAELQCIVAEMLDAYVLRTKHWRDTELGKEEDKLEKDLCQEATGTT
jgi:hypothetical protein